MVLKQKKYPPHIKEFDNFEAKLISLVRLIKYTTTNKE